MTTDLIIACSSGYEWDVIRYWCNSLNKSGFKGTKAVLFLDGSSDVVEKTQRAGINAILVDPSEPVNNIPPHVRRFGYLYDFLYRNQFRYVVTTDIRDVVFQSDPIDWIEKNIGEKQCVFSSESLRYVDEPWGNQNLFETFGPYFYDKFKYNEIFNVGVLAGKFDAIKAICCNIFNTAVTKNIPICDQSTFNFMISQEPYLSTSAYMRSEDGWACQLGTTGDPSKLDFFSSKLLEPIPVSKDGIVYTSTGKQFVIVHQYDRVPHLRKEIERIFYE